MNLLQTVTLSEQFCMDELKDRISIADNVASKTFLFTLPWDMERTVTPVHFEKTVDWNYMPEDDVEWTVMLNRQRYFVCLAQAFAATKNQKYLDTFLELASDFIRSVPLEANRGNYCWRTIDSGIRCMNWVWTLKIFKSCTTLPADFLSLVAASLKKHINYLIDSYDSTHLISNWGILANSGALSACFYLEANGCGSFQKQIDLLLQRLDEQIDIQVLPDGWHWEQSPMYHQEVLWCCLELILMLRENNRPPTALILNKTKKMCYATLYSAKPNHRQLMRGDSDDTDVRDILTLGAFLFQDKTLKSGGYEFLDLDNLWRLGSEGAELYQKLPNCLPNRSSIAMEESGNYFFRTSWEKDAAFLAFKCGHLGSGHGHGDLLHFDLFANGEDILVDSGRYTYVNNETRLYLKSPFSHNTLTIDGKPFTECSSSWQYGAVARPIKGNWYEDKNYYYVSGAHLGYSRDGVFLRRQIVVIKPGIYILCDSIYGSCRHSCLQKFHFHNAAIPLLENSHTVSYDTAANHVRIYLLNQDAAVSVTPSTLSRSYHSLETSHCIEAEHNIPENHSLLTVIGLGNMADLEVEKLPVTQPREGKTLDDGTACALSIQGNGFRYIVIFSTNHPTGGINLLSAGEEIGYGEVMVFDHNHHRTTLSY